MVSRGQQLLEEQARPPQVLFLPLGIVLLFVFVLLLDILLPFVFVLLIDLSPFSCLCCACVIHIIVKMVTQVCRPQREVSLP